MRYDSFVGVKISIADCMQQRPSFYSPSADLQISVFMAPKVPFHRRRNTTLTLIVYHIIVVENVMIKIRFNIILLSKPKSLNFSLHVSRPIFPLYPNFHFKFPDQFFLSKFSLHVSRPVFPLQNFTSYFPTNVSSFSEISSHVPQPILLLFSKFSLYVSRPVLPLQIFTTVSPTNFSTFFMFS